MAWIERVLRALDRFQQGHTVLGFPVAVAKKYGDDQAGKHAALLAYYGFLSLFPLLLVFVTLLGYALANNQELQQQIIDTLIAQFPVRAPRSKTASPPSRAPASAWSSASSAPCGAVWGSPRAPRTP